MLESHALISQTIQHDNIDELFRLRLIGIRIVFFSFLNIQTFDPYGSDFLRIIGISTTQGKMLPINMTKVSYSGLATGPSGQTQPWQCHLCQRQNDNQDVFCTRCPLLPDNETCPPRAGSSQPTETATQPTAVVRGAEPTVATASRAADDTGHFSINISNDSVDTPNGAIDMADTKGAERKKWRRQMAPGMVWTQDEIARLEAESGRGCMWVKPDNYTWMDVLVLVCILKVGLIIGVVATLGYISYMLRGP